MKALLTIAMVAAALAFAAPAVAGTSDPGPVSKQLWHMTDLDAAASEIAGFPVTVVASDSIPEWTALIDGDDPYSVAGFTYVYANPSSLLFNPYDGGHYGAYHTVFLNPTIYATLHTGLTQANPHDAAVALLVLDHESQHQRLHSGDESRVNACALADLPRFTAKWIVPTTIQNVQVPQSYRTKVRYRAKVHGRSVWRSRYITKVRNVLQQQTVANPAYTAVLDAAHEIYVHQPAPYNAGTCW
jgi:hypothetical protein